MHEGKEQAIPFTTWLHIFELVVFRPHATCTLIIPDRITTAASPPAGQRTAGMHAAPPIATPHTNAI